MGDCDNFNGCNFVHTSWRKNKLITQLDVKSRKNAPGSEEKGGTSSKLGDTTAGEGEAEKEDKKGGDDAEDSTEEVKPLLPGRLYSKLEDNYHLSNKKALFMNMTQYYRALNQDPWDTLPLTFHVKYGARDPEFQRFDEEFKRGQNLAKELEKKKNVELRYLRQNFTQIMKEEEEKNARD